MKIKADAWFFFCRNDRPLLPRAAHPELKRLEPMIRDWIKTTGFKARPGEVTSFPSWASFPSRFIMLGGMGDENACPSDTVIRTAGAAGRAMRRLKIASIAVSTSAEPPFPSVSAPRLVEWFATGLADGHYRFEKFLSVEGGAKTNRPLQLYFADAGKASRELDQAAREVSALADTLSLVRDLANLPANEAPPGVIAKHAAAWARRFGLSCSVLGRRELERKGCRALLAVAQGSQHDAKLITLKYRGRNPGLAPLVLVGKTITFDAGGLSLKTAKGMEWMKYDKCGGMAVLAATLAAARLGVRHPVIGVLAAAENMPGGKALRPGDILRSYSGKTIEVLNTDAEGRLVLADALAIAAEHKPAAIVDLATLTGACIVALGHVLAGVMGNDPRLVDELKQAGEDSGDRLWPLPLLPEYDECIRSDFADMKNVGDGSAGTIIGGAFLKRFVPDGIPWAHLDIAGTAHHEKDRSHAAAGATLFGARLLVEWMRRKDRSGRPPKA